MLHLFKYNLLDSAIKHLFSLDAEFTFLMKSINFSRIIEVSVQSITNPTAGSPKEVLTGASAQLSTLRSQLVVRKEEEVLRSDEIAN